MECLSRHAHAGIWWQGVCFKSDAFSNLSVEPKGFTSQPIANTLPNQMSAQTGGWRLTHAGSNPAL